MRPTEAVFTAQITTRMCANDDQNLIEDGERIGGPNEFSYIIETLREGYTPIDDASSLAHIHQPTTSSGTASFPFLCSQC
jgi:hypothetical protein